MSVVVKDFRITNDRLKDMRQLRDAVAALFVHDLVRVLDGTSEIFSI